MQNEIIVVKQLPVIEEQLQNIKTEITAKVEQALNLACNEETVKNVKTVRAELNKEFKAFEERRKEVKKAVLSPYEQFETIYKDCITDLFKMADEELKNKVDDVEGELKSQKREDVKAYFDEYMQSKGIDFVTFDDANISITLSASMKSLKEQAKAFIDKIEDDLNLIGTQAFPDEILVEYHKSLNVSNAITTVVERHKTLDQIANTKEETDEKTSEKKAELVEAVAPPVVQEDKTYILTFKVKATKSKLIELKKFLKKNGYDYE